MKRDVYSVLGSPMPGLCMKKMRADGVEPPAFRISDGRSATELHAQNLARVESNHRRPLSKRGILPLNYGPTQHNATPIENWLGWIRTIDLLLRREGFFR